MTGARIRFVTIYDFGTGIVVSFYNDNLPSILRWRYDAIALAGAGRKQSYLLEGDIGMQAADLPPWNEVHLAPEQSQHWIEKQAGRRLSVSIDLQDEAGEAPPVVVSMWCL
jgi:hypothetical protein